jgi:hypothetical protein
MRFDHYSEVPAFMAKEIIEKSGYNAMLHMEGF